MTNQGQLDVYCSVYYLEGLKKYDKKSAKQNSANRSPKTIDLCRII